VIAMYACLGLRSVSQFPADSRHSVTEDRVSLPHRIITLLARERMRVAGIDADVNRHSHRQR
jgi:hypothetical protein